MPHESPQFIRVLFNAPVRLTTAQGTVPVRVLDMTKCDALVIMPQSLSIPVGSICRLHLQLGEASAHFSQRIRMRAREVYRHSNCAGLLCQHMDLDSVTHLRRLIELQLGRAALLESDLAELGSQSGNSHSSTTT